jgi:hypothetical protein
MGNAFRYATSGACWARYKGQGSTHKQAAAALIELLKRKGYNIQEWETKKPLRPRGSAPDSIYFQHHGTLTIMYEKHGAWFYAFLEREDRLPANKVKYK